MIKMLLQCAGLEVYAIFSLCGAGDGPLVSCTLPYKLAFSVSSPMSVYQCTEYMRVVCRKAGERMLWCTDVRGKGQVLVFIFYLF